MMTKTRRQTTQDMSDTPSQIFTKFVGSIKTKPRSQQHMSLGIYNYRNPAKGFCVELDRNYDDERKVITSITPLGSGSRYEYILHIVNKSGRTITADVWQM